MAFLAAMGMALVSGLQVWQHYDNQIEAADRLAEALTRAAAEKIGGSLRSIDLLLQDVSGQFLDDPAPNSDSFVRYLNARAQAFPEIRSTFVAGADGKGIAGTVPVGGLDLSDRSYFQQTRDAAASPRLILSEPLTSRVQKVPTIFAARPVLDDAGHFRGIAGAGIDPQFFIDALAAITPGDTARGLLVRRDGVVFVRQPDPMASLGKDMSKSPLFRHLATAPAGHYRSPSHFDGVERTVAYRTLEPYGLVVGIAVPLEGFLGPWRNSAIVTGIGNLMLAVAAFFLGLILDHRRAERLQVESRLRESRDELARRGDDLEHSNAELRQFAHVAAHDLQEPLRNITNYLGLLDRRHGAALPPEAADYIRIVIDSTRRLHRLIRDLQEFSEVSTRDQPLVPVDTSRLCMNAEAALAPALATSEASIVRDPLPTVMADGPLIEKVFLHLLNNALKYRSPDRAPVLHVGARRQAGEWVFAIRDNGIGIAPDYFKRIFRVFQRLHTQEVYEGTGIGLPLCKKIIERHGGRIWVESTPGEGSTFYFTLPAPEPALSPSAVPPSGPDTGR